MAKNFSLDFDGFLDVAREIDELGDGYLQKAVDAAFTASKDYVNGEIEKAMNASKYNFDGTGYSKGTAKKSLKEIEKKPVQWSGSIASAYIGVDLKEAPEVLFIMHGTPHMKKDTALFNAVKVKGKVKQEVEKIQAEEFYKVLAEGLGND
jgi:Icc-related predicted phosphoesterase